MILAVDLAARYSAVVGIDASGEVMLQYDSRNSSLSEFLAELGQSAILPVFSLVILEDVPHGQRFRKDVKIACRMQGMVLKELIDLGVSDKVLFVQPSAWKPYYKVPSKRKEKVAREVALSLGYEPPNLHSSLHKQERTLARKSESDYVDAFLIARWALDQINAGIEFDTIKTTDRYNPW